MSAAPYDSGGIYGNALFPGPAAAGTAADAVIAWLREQGFRLRGVYNMSYDGDGRAVQADFLFGRRPIRSAL